LTENENTEERSEQRYPGVTTRIVIDNHENEVRDIQREVSARLSEALGVSVEVSENQPENEVELRGVSLVDAVDETQENLNPMQTITLRDGRSDILAYPMENPDTGEVTLQTSSRCTDPECPDQSTRHVHLPSGAGLPIPARPENTEVTPTVRLQGWDVPHRRRTWTPLNMSAGDPTDRAIFEPLNEPDDPIDEVADTDEEPTEPVDPFMRIDPEDGKLVIYADTVQIANTEVIWIEDTVDQFFARFKVIVFRNPETEEIYGSYVKQPWKQEL
jgi:hypothetical protein